MNNFNCVLITKTWYVAVFCRIMLYNCLYCCFLWVSNLRNNRENTSFTRNVPSMICKESLIEGKCKRMRCPEFLLMECIIKCILISLNRDKIGGIRWNLKWKVHKTREKIAKQGLLSKNTSLYCQTGILDFDKLISS